MTPTHVTLYTSNRVTEDFFFGETNLCNFYFFASYNMRTFSLSIMNPQIFLLSFTCHNNKLSNFRNLLDKDRSVSVNTRNVQTLVIEMYKVSKGIAPNIFSAVILMQITIYVISLSLVDPW